MEGHQEGVEPLDRAHDLSSLSGEVEAVARGDRSMQQRPWTAGRPMSAPACAPAPSPATPHCSRDHVRPDLGARPLKQLTAAGGPGPLRPAGRQRTPGRQAGRAGPQHILAVHRCLHRALAQAVTWRLLARNVATDTTPPPVPHHRGGGAGARAGRGAVGRRRPHPQPVAWPLDGAGGGDRGPQRRTVRPGMGRPGPGRRHHPVPPGLHHHRPSRPPRRRRPRLEQQAQGTGGRAGQVRRQQRRPHPATVRRPGAPPAPPPAGPPASRLRAAPYGTAAQGRTRPAAPAGPAGPGVPHRAGHTGQPQPRQPRLRPPAASVGLAAHPHMLRHALALAMAANKEPASIIAAQLRRHRPVTGFVPSSYGLRLRLEGSGGR